jgi:two-component sensor histidine kinase
VVEGELLGTLVDELNHRVRNMLQVVSAIAGHTLREAGSVEEFGVTFTGRLKALAAAHELVSRSGWKQRAPAGPDREGAAALWQRLRPPRHGGRAPPG